MALNKNLSELTSFVKSKQKSYKIYDIEVKREKKKFLIQKKDRKLTISSDQLENWIIVWWPRRISELIDTDPKKACSEIKEYFTYFPGPLELNEELEKKIKTHRKKVCNEKNLCDMVLTPVE